jgi:RHS repeat-associated protein
MPGRKFNTNSYKYGFNGKEKDNEVSGEGNSYDYGMRIYDPRLGRFLSVDPLTNSYPWYTPYQFAGNKPIRYVDIDGLEEGESKVSLQGKLTYSSGKLNFGLGIQYQANKNLSITLNTNNATDNSKITFSAFANVHSLVSGGVTLNTNGTVDLFGGTSKQSETPKAPVNSKDGSPKVSIPPIEGPLVTPDDVANSSSNEISDNAGKTANTNSTNSTMTTKAGEIKLNPQEKTNAEEKTVYGTNYAQNDTQGEKQSANTAISTNTKPTTGAKTLPSRDNIKAAILNTK